jgi:hypothetical protein
VVKDAVALPGLFPLYQKEEKVFIELKPEQMGKPFYLSINRTRGLGEGFIYPFMMRGYLVEFRKVGGLVQMIAKNAQFALPRARRSRRPRARASPTACSRRAGRERPAPRAQVVPGRRERALPERHRRHRDRARARYPRQYSFDQRNSSFTRVRATGDMSTFEVSAHFAVPKLPPPARVPRAPAPRTRRRSRTAQHVPGLPLQSRKAAAEPMRARAADAASATS